ncbi:MAG: BON domain-containing protein [Dysgonamonadaceae bacterium]|jgi:osmotically-inducible protein OsmY|nr:BON domain-containing protein [Dysgonamonadaceae bacterium]
MKRNLVLFGIVLFAGIMLYSCKPSDEKLQQEVTAALAASPVPLTSEVKDGVVTLTGVVESEDAKTAAETLLSAIKGVQSVVNNIEVKIPEPVLTPDELLSQAVSQAISGLGDAASGVLVAVKDSIVTLTGEIKKADAAKVKAAVGALNLQVVDSLLVK